MAIEVVGLFTPSREALSRGGATDVAGLLGLAPRVLWPPGLPLPRLGLENRVQHRPVNGSAGNPSALWSERELPFAVVAVTIRSVVPLLLVPGRHRPVVICRTHIESLEKRRSHRQSFADLRWCVRVSRSRYSPRTAQM